MKLFLKNILFVFIVLKLLISCGNQESQESSNVTQKKQTPLSWLKVRLPKKLKERIRQGIATKKEILVAFENDNINELTRVVNSLIVYINHYEVIVIVRDLWLENKIKYPSLAWKALSNPRVKISLAFVLVQIDKDHFTEYESFIRKSLSHSDSEVRSVAAFVIGIIGSEQDISFLIEMIVNDSFGVATGAINGLSLIRTKKANEELLKLTQDYRLTKRKKQFVNNLLRRMKAVGNNN